MEQLNLCIVTTSRQILFNSEPLTLKYVCPGLVEGVKIMNNVDKKETSIKLMILRIRITINIRITSTTIIIVVIVTVILMVKIVRLKIAL